MVWGLPHSSAGKESTCNAGDLVSVPGLGRSPGERKGYPLQYSGLENSMSCIVCGIPKRWTQLSNFHFHFSDDITQPSFLRDLVLWESYLLRPTWYTCPFMVLIGRGIYQEASRWITLLKCSLLPSWVLSLLPWWGWWLLFLPAGCWIQGVRMLGKPP